MVKRADYKAMTELLYCLRQKQGKANSYIQKEKRTRQRNILDSQLQERLDWFSQNWREYFSIASISSTLSLRQSWWRDENWPDDR